MDPVRINNAEEWQRRIGDTVFPLVMKAASPAFTGSIRTVDLPRGVRISEIDVESNHLIRTDRLIKTMPSEHVLVLFQYKGQAIMREATRRVLLEKGSAAIADPSQPYEVSMTSGSHQLVFLLPEASVRAAGAKVSEVSTRLLPGSSLAVRHLSLLVTDLVSVDLAPAEVEGLTAAAVDLLRSALTGLGTSPALGSVTREALRRIVQDYIHRHLGDPGLSVESVAKAHQISVRHLAVVFGSDSTPGEYIRKARLQKVFDDLVNPDLEAMTASQIAYRWGFTNYPTLTRAFRREFEIAPNEVRAYRRRSP